MNGFYFYVTFLEQLNCRMSYIYICCPLFVLCVCVTGDRLSEVHQQDLPSADLPPDPSLQVDKTERGQEEVTGLVSVSFVLCHHSSDRQSLPQ